MTNQPPPARPDRTAGDAEQMERAAQRDDSQRGAENHPNNIPPSPTPPPEERTK